MQQVNEIQQAALHINVSPCLHGGTCPKLENSENSICQCYLRLPFLVPMEESVMIYHEDIAIVAVQSLLDQFVNVVWEPANQVQEMDVFVVKPLIKLLQTWM